MISGSGARMQGVSYPPAYYHTVDNNVDFSGTLWQVVNNGGMVYRVLIEPSCSGQYLGCGTEILRQTMLNHEAMFRSQVHELHRVHRRQRELMDEIRRRELSKDHILIKSSESNFLLSQQCNVSQKVVQMPWDFQNPRDRNPFAQGAENFQRPSTFVSGKNMQAGSNIYLEESNLEDHKVSLSKRHNSGKRMLDLELPAEEYIDSEEEEVRQIQHKPSKGASESPPECDFKLNKGSSCKGDQSCSKTNYLFDLNEPIQLDESGTPNSSSFVDSNSSSMEIMHQCRDIFEKAKSESHVLSEDITYILEGKGHEGSSLVTSHQASFGGKSHLTCEDGTSLASEFSKKDNESFDDNDRSMSGSHITSSCQPVPFSDMAKTEASTSVSSHDNFREIPIAIQALPCFNATQFLSGTSKSSIPSSGIKRKYSYSKQEPGCSSSLGSVKTCITSNAERHSVKRFIKDANPAKSLECMDLNVMPSDFLPETVVIQENIKSIDSENLSENTAAQFNRIRGKSDNDDDLVSCPNFPKSPDCSVQSFALASASSNTKSSKTKDKDILNGEKAWVYSSSLASGSSDKSENYCNGDLVPANVIVKEHSNSKKYINLDASIGEGPVLTVPTDTLKMAAGTDCDAPISLDNKVYSPPGRDSEDNQMEIPLILSKEKIGDPNEDLDKIAAEAIISISLSGDQQCPKTATIGPLEASSNCLDWFAGIVSSVAGDLENEILLDDTPGDVCNVPSPGGIQQSEARTLKFTTQTKVEHHLSKPVNRKSKRISGILWPSQQEMGRPKKLRKRKEFQSKGLPHSASLTSCGVAENLEPIEKLILAAGTPPGIVTGRRNVCTNLRNRGSRQFKAFYSNVMETRVCPLLKDHTNESGLSFVPICLNGWEKKNRRQKNRRARATYLLGFS